MHCLAQNKVTSMINFRTTLFWAMLATHFVNKPSIRVLYSVGQCFSCKHGLVMFYTAAMCFIHFSWNLFNEKQGSFTKQPIALSLKSAQKIQNTHSTTVLYTIQGYISNHLNWIICMLYFPNKVQGHTWSSDGLLYFFWQSILFSSW